MTPVPTLTDGVVTLRGHREDDVTAVLGQCTDAEMQAWTSVPSPYTLDDAKTYVRHLVPGGWAADAVWSFAVTAHDDDGVERFAGGVALENRGDGLAELGYGTSAWARRRGLTERACRLLLTWGLEQRGLLAVEWVAKQWNWPSRRLAWRLGFAVGQERAWMHQRGALVPAWRGTLARGEPLEPRHPWYDVPVLGERDVLLRPPAESDLPRMLECLDDPEVRRWSEGPRERAPRTAERRPDPVQERREWAARGEAVAWTVADPATDAHLGLVQLHHLQHRRQAELGFWAHPDARGRGLTTRAVRVALRHAFVPWEDGGLGLRRVHAHAAEANRASCRVLLAAGLTRTGRDRSEVLLADGGVADAARFDVLAEEWGRA